MKIRTNTTRWDLILFNFSVIPRMRSTYVGIVLLAVGIFFFLIYKNGMPNAAPGWWVLSFVSIVGAVGGITAGSLFSVIYILSTSSNKNGILGEHEYELRPEGLFEKTEANEGLSKWNGILDVREVGSFLLFRISGYLFHIIPKRSFESKQSYLEFKNKALELWEKNA